MTRIVAGEYRGRRLHAPAGQDTRPTSDRVREALFSTLEALTALDGARFADLYAGSGAVGLEACSRGASRVLLVEAAVKAARVARDNIDTLGAAATARLVTDRVERVLASAPETPYDVVFADPPYALPAERVTEMLEALAAGWLAPDAVIVVERSSRGAPLEWVQGITGISSRRYGETTLWYGRAS